jgi:subtilisin family serine protease
MAAALALAAGGGTQAQAASTPATALYIVQVDGDPLASYSGGVAGLAATKPESGHKLDARSPKAMAYRDHLKAKQQEVLRAAGVDIAKTIYQYDLTFNGVAVPLTAAQAQKMQHTKGVAAVWKNRMVSTKTLTTPKFLGLTGANGVWRRYFGGDSNAGNGVIIADIDSGFWPESKSFGALPTPRSDDAIIAAKWHGTCVAGTDHPVTCNNKVLGARWFDSAKLADKFPGEFHSPRDYDGHGTHTGSTAAGNLVHDASVGNTPVGDVEGIAPGARLSVYKVLWQGSDGQAHGTTVDIIAAVNAAVQDGADVINYSIGDNVDAFGPEDISFLQAAAAGVFVSAAAGNSGPGASTVDNAMPWVTTVGAGTHDEAYPKTVTLGNGAKYTGVGVGLAVPSSPLADAATSGLPGHTDNTICTPGSLDPAKVTGKIVLCQRGVIARTDKSVAVQQAGGVGMIMYNPSPNSFNADYHVVPTIHVDTATGQAIRAYIAGTASPTAALSAGTPTKQEAPSVTDFSARGPTVSSSGDLIKPDIIAPGNDVVAAVSPSTRGFSYDSESGTSMSTPHIAGIAALLMSKHPDWSPMWVKSAIMTTADTHTNRGNPIKAGSADATPLDMGSGEVDPDEAFQPGLVYDSTPTEWLQFTCGIGIHLQSNGADVCDTTGIIAPNQLNYPSISFGTLAGTGTVTRTVTNITNRWSVYYAQVKAPTGYKVTVNPPILLIRPGGKASFQVTVTRTTAGFGSYAFGSLTWRDFANHKVTSPIGVRAVPLAAPLEVTGTGTSGSTALKIRTGYAGTLKAGTAGLAADTVNTLSLTTVGGTGFNPAIPEKIGPDTGRVNITVPAGTKLARFSTIGAEYAPGTDVDLFVYKTDPSGGLEQVGQSAGGTADEVVDLTEPGTYAVFVNLFANPGSNPLPVKLHSWTVGASLGNFTATPASQAVTVGGTATITASWTGLDPAHRYLGLVEYSDATSVVGSTTVSVTP